MGHRARQGERRATRKVNSFPKGLPIQGRIRRLGHKWLRWTEKGRSFRTSACRLFFKSRGSCNMKDMKSMRGSAHDPSWPSCSSW